MRGIEMAAWGTVGRDPELKSSRGGMPYCSVSVAVSTGKDDAGKDLTTWVKVTAFKDLAEEAAKALVKGARVYFEGTGTVEQWQAADGTTRTQLAVIAWKLLRVSAIGQNRQRAEGQRMGEGFHAPIDRMKQSASASAFNDEIPF